MKLKDFDFRIWNKKENEFVNIDCSISFKFGEKYEREDYVHFTSYIYEGGIRDKEHTWISPLCYENDDLELELFTGLYDKNRRKIYEGDILGFYDRGDYINCSVFYNKDKAMFVAIIDDEGEKLTSMLEIIHAAYGRGGVEVVGNIHENLELLKSKDSKWK